MSSRSMPLALALLAAATLAGPLPAATAAAPGSGPRYSPGTTGMNNPALRYFQGTPAVTPTGPSRPQPLPSAPAPAPATPRVEKPFSDTVLQPTVTPYLALGLLENSTGLPNYHLFVRPQLEQQRQVQMQQMQNQRIERQLRAASRRSASTTGGTARFQNYGTYYPTR